jgi:hypothetical protein
MPLTVRQRALGYQTQTDQQRKPDEWLLVPPEMQTRLDAIASAILWARRTSCLDYGRQQLTGSGYHVAAICARRNETDHGGRVGLLSYDAVAWFDCDGHQPPDEKCRFDDFVFGPDGSPVGAQPLDPTKHQQLVEFWEFTHNTHERDVVFVRPPSVHFPWQVSPNSPPTEATAAFASGTWRTATNAAKREREVQSDVMDDLDPANQPLRRTMQGY